jgi:hypothetical protein
MFAHGREVHAAPNKTRHVCGRHRVVRWQCLVSAQCLSRTKPGERYVPGYRLRGNRWAGG